MPPPTAARWMATELQPGLSPFVARHIGPDAAQQARMLADLGLADLEALAAQVVPDAIRLAPDQAELGLPQGCDEAQALLELQAIAAGNAVRRSLIGLGYYGCITPALLQRHVFENPAWYTAYTPYQAELSQGRLEALLNFQTLISELTGLPIANASLLDEATAAAEAMALSAAACGRPEARRFLVDQAVFPQTWAVLQTRAEPLDIELVPVDPRQLEQQPYRFDGAFGLLLQLPGADGLLWDPAPVVAAARAAGVMVTAALDPLAQVLMQPVGALGVEIAVGSTQRFGVPMGFGGPHAAFFATTTAQQRRIPGRLVGQSLDAEGRPALRLALQTREQHIRRDKATSNICTAQVLLAVMAGFYAVHHGPDGLAVIARRVLRLRELLRRGLIAIGLEPESGPGFDTLRLATPAAAELLRRAEDAGFNLRPEGPHGALAASTSAPTGLAISLDELSDHEELVRLLTALAGETAVGSSASGSAVPAAPGAGQAPLLAQLEAQLDAELDAAGLTASPERLLWGNAIPQRQDPWLLPAAAAVAPKAVEVPIAAAAEVELPVARIALQADEGFKTGALPEPIAPLGLLLCWLQHQLLQGPRELIRERQPLRPPLHLRVERKGVDTGAGGEGPQLGHQGAEQAASRCTRLRRGAIWASMLAVSRNCTRARCRLCSGCRALKYTLPLRWSVKNRSPSSKLISRAASGSRATSWAVSSDPASAR